MTEIPLDDQTVSAPAAPARKPARPSRKPGWLPTIALALASFMVLFEFLSFQLATGKDPALGAKATEVAFKGQVARPTIRRKVVKTRMVHLPGQSAASSGVVASSGSTSSSSAAPATSSSAAPAASSAPPPAPAPAPAPVTASS